MPTKPTLAEKLTAQATEAAELRAIATNPDVVALGVEKVRRQVSRMSWTGILLGLAFTMVNVQVFAAGAATTWSLPWCAAWFLDPMVSLVLIALLRTEQTIARWEVRAGAWVRRARWFTLAATYGMNTWTAWTAGAPSQVLLHSVPVLLVFFGSEAITDAHEALTRAIYAAATRQPVTRLVPDPGGVRSEDISASYRVPVPAVVPVASSPVSVPVTPVPVRGDEVDPPTVPTLVPESERESVPGGTWADKYGDVVEAVRKWDAAYAADPTTEKPTVRRVRERHNVGTDIAGWALREARA